MKRRIISAATFAACLALCAAVWPQAGATEETPAVPTPTAVTATKPKGLEKPESVEFTMPEEEKTETTEPEQAEAVTSAPEPPQTPTPPEKEKIVILKQEPEAAPASPDTPPDNMVYVPGFGWLESQGPNHCEYAEDMYENGNKIGIMG